MLYSHVRAAVVLLGCSLTPATALGGAWRHAILRGGQRTRGLVGQAIADNPLLAQDGLPLFSSIDATHVKDAVSGTLEQMESQFEQLESTLDEKTCTYSD